jgi:hypothetical protein
MSDIRVLYSKDESGHGQDVGLDCKLQELALRVGSFKQEAVLDLPLRLCRVQFYSDVASLTRLYDFLEIKVSRRASTRSRAPGKHRS